MEGKLEAELPGQDHLRGREIFSLPRNVPESSGASPRAVGRVFAIERESCPRDLRAISGRQDGILKAHDSDSPKREKPLTAEVAKKKRKGRRGNPVSLCALRSFSLRPPRLKAFDFHPR